MSNNNYIFREILKINNNSFEKIIDGSDENNCLKGINKDEAINFCNNDDKCNIIYTPTGGIGNEFCFKNKINKSYTNQNDNRTIYNIYLKKNYDPIIGIIADKCSLNYKDTLSYFNLIKENLKNKYDNEKINFKKYYDIVDKLLYDEMIKKEFNIYNQTIVDLHDNLLKYIYSYKKKSLNIVDKYSHINNVITIKNIIPTLYNLSNISNNILIHRIINRESSLTDEELYDMYESNSQINVDLHNDFRNFMDKQNN